MIYTLEIDEKAVEFGLGSAGIEKIFGRVIPLEVGEAES